MIVNPFTSKTFVSVWSKHFNNSRPSISFKFINQVAFYKHIFLPLYINIGKNLTKGIYYSLDVTCNDYKGKVVLIYDVPSYFDVITDFEKNSSSLSIKKVYQYSGYLMDINDFDSAESYIKSRFSSKNIRDIRSCERRLHTCFNIRYQMYFDDISQQDYDRVFEHFYRLLSIRFLEKNTNYHHLDKKKWAYYKSLVLPMILDKKASLLVIYDTNTPIGITLNFHSETILFETITVFDINYHKFSVGKISITKLLKWCFDNNYQYSDFSKGEFDYKKKWSNVEYTFDYHILYDSKNLISVSIANTLERYFKFKLFLRTKKLNSTYRLLLYKIKNPFGTGKHLNNQQFKLEAFDDNFIDLREYTKIQIENKAYDFMLKAVFEFVFAHPENIDEVQVYESIKNKNQFLIQGKEVTQSVQFY